jgi:CHRD domain
VAAAVDRRPQSVRLAVEHRRIGMSTSLALRRLLFLPVALALLLAMVPGTAVASSGTIVATIMTGAKEAPGPGDPDGSGVAAFVLRPDTGRICWAYAVKRVDPIQAAHIHRAPVGSPGPVVVPIGASGSRGYSIGCTNADPALVAEIAANPSAFYFNVHNDAFPDGAIRGQLHG